MTTFVHERAPLNDFGTGIDWPDIDAYVMTKDARGNIYPLQGCNPDVTHKARWVVFFHTIMETEANRLMRAESTPDVMDVANGVQLLEGHVGMYQDLCKSTVPLQCHFSGLPDHIGMMRSNMEWVLSMMVSALIEAFPLILNDDSGIQYRHAVASVSAVMFYTQMASECVARLGGRRWIQLEKDGVIMEYTSVTP